MGVTTAFSQALNAASGGNNGYTFVHRYEVAGLTLPAGAIARVRCTFQANTGTEGFGITNAYIGHAAAAGDAYDFAATPVQLTFDSGSGSKTIAASTSATTDWVTFAYDKTNPLVIAWYLNAGTGNDEMRYIASDIANHATYFKSATNEAGTVNKTTGYNAPAAEYYAITSIEVETVDFISRVIFL